MRGLTQDDSHSYVTPEQAPDEIRHLLAFVLGLLRDFGLDDYYLELSTRGDDPDKFIGSEEEWAVATAVLEDAAKETGLELVPDPGGAAFYGPKISVQARTPSAAPGRCRPSSTTSTSPPGSAWSTPRPTAVGAAGDDPFGEVRVDRAVLRRPHRALRGRVPGWLAPVQVVGIPITDEQVPYLTDVAKQLKASGIRVEIDDSDDRMQKKIRTASKQKVPFVLLAGGHRCRGRGGLLPLPRRVTAQRRPRGPAVEQIAAWVGRAAQAVPSAEVPVAG